MVNKRRGKRIASARLGAGFRSAASFAEAVGKSEPTIRAYESGRTSPPTEVLVRISELTGKSIQWLLGEEEEANAENITISMDAFRQLITKSDQQDNQQKDLLEILPEGPDPGAIELINDTELCQSLHITPFEIKVLTSIRGGALKTKDKAIAVIMTLRS